MMWVWNILELVSRWVSGTTGRRQYKVNNDQNKTIDILLSAEEERFGSHAETDCIPIISVCSIHPRCLVQMLDFGYYPK